jgi:hypothetical protein
MEPRSGAEAYVIALPFMVKYGAREHDGAGADRH